MNAFPSKTEMAAYIVREFYNYEIVDFESINITFGPHPLEASVSFDDKSLKLSGAFVSRLKGLKGEAIHITKE